MTNLRVCTFEQRGRLSPGLMAADGVLPLGKAYAALEGSPPAPATLMELIGELTRNLPLLDLISERLERGDPALHQAVLPLEQVRLKAPLLYPGKMFCAGANYFDHAKEMGGPDWDKVDPNVEPFFFVKPADNTVIGTGDPIAIPRNSKALDWEVELGIIMGRRCRGVAIGQAADCVAGYTVFVDMTARDLSRRPTHIFKNDFVAGKCFDGASPMGPCVLLKRPGEKLREFALRLSVNDRIRQDSTTAQMIIRPERQISWLSETITLNPGDVIATGTPAGVGFPRKDFLKAGDVIRAEIDDIGVLVNQVVSGG